VLLHLGDDDWCIVDSCLSRGLSDSVAIEYLNGFQREALKKVRLVVATHWHDDHIRGLASILREVPSASFFCSAALNTDNFFTLVGTAASGVQGRSGVDEFASILGLIESKAHTEREKKLASPGWATANRVLLNLPNQGRHFRATVTSLSPSDGTIKLAITDIGQLLPKTGERQRRITNQPANHTSVVLWVEAGPIRALLGADLEQTGQAAEGWTAVVGSHRDPQSAAFIKVPHHGSANADCAEVWERMMLDNPIAVVTPFTGGSTRLPRESDLHRLSTRTSNLYCTAEGAGKEPPRDSVVEKMMRQQLTERRVIEGQPGHVRVRWALNGQQPNPIVETFHGAYRVNRA
jgi:beta-lactamase superfamily II metal-dependent hydrolase